MTVSLSLFDVITKATVTTEKRLMIDLNAVKEAYQKHEIMDIGVVQNVLPARVSAETKDK